MPGLLPLLPLHISEHSRIAWRFTEAKNEAQRFPDRECRSTKQHPHSDHLSDGARSRPSRGSRWRLCSSAGKIAGKRSAALNLREPGAVFSGTAISPFLTKITVYSGLRFAGLALCALRTGPNFDDRRKGRPQRRHFRSAPSLRFWWRYSEKHSGEQVIPPRLALASGTSPRQRPSLIRSSVLITQRNFTASPSPAWHAQSARPHCSLRAPSLVRLPAEQ